MLPTNPVSSAPLQESRVFKYFNSALKVVGFVAVIVFEGFALLSLGYMSWSRYGGATILFFMVLGGFLLYKLVTARRGAVILWFATLLPGFCAFLFMMWAIVEYHL